MKNLSINPDSATAPRRTQFRPERARESLANANPYSPLLCLSVLLTVGLIILGQ
jgi:hypothetical protein